MTEPQNNHQEEHIANPDKEPANGLGSQTGKGKQPPGNQGYRIKINGEHYTVQAQSITGREVLALAGLAPPENYTLRVKIAGQPPRKVELGEQVDLRTPGIEQFKALPRDQTEG